MKTNQTTPTTEQKLADAFRLIALRLEDAIERGRKKMDAEDLRETLLALADAIDSPVPDAPNLISPSFACPCCGERVSDLLIWQDDETVRCHTCGHSYAP